MVPAIAVVRVASRLRVGRRVRQLPQRGLRQRGHQRDEDPVTADAGRAGEVLDLAAAKGLLMLQAGPDVLRFVPSLNITDEEVGEGLSRLHAALRAFAKPG